MTQTIRRPPDEDTTKTREVPSHPHYTLGTLIVIGVVGTGTGLLILGA